MERREVHHWCGRADATGPGTPNSIQLPPRSLWRHPSKRTITHLPQATRDKREFADFDWQTCNDADNTGRDYSGSRPGSILPAGSDRVYLKRINKSRLASRVALIRRMPDKSPRFRQPIRVLRPKWRIFGRNLLLRLFRFDIVFIP